MSKKDVVYIDIEDDITGIIDKVKASSGEIVALVPPKRSTVLQSAVNMKLLKRIADKDNKKVVLISSEPSLMPLAGGVGLFMADTLQSRPKIPVVEKAEIDDSVIEDDELIDDATAEAAGVAVGTAAVVGASKKDAEAAAVAPVASKAKASKMKPMKGNSKIPNFSKFRLRMILAGLAVFLLLIFWFVGYRILPKADIVVQAQTSRVPINSTFVADTEAETHIDNGVLEATQQTLTTTLTEDFDATGEKDVGNKASGTMTVENCYSSTTLNVPAGTTFTDPSTGHKFTSNTEIDVPGGVFVGTCTSPGEKSVSVTAANSGDDKNLSPRNYAVSGYGSKVTGSGEQMSGGTTKKVKIVSQADVDAAAKRLDERSTDEEKDKLTDQFNDSQYPITGSFEVKAGPKSPQPAVGAEGTKGTLSATYTYTMLGVEKDAINQFLEKAGKDKLGDDSDQSIIETGLDQASISIPSKDSPTKITVGVKTNGFAGPELDEDALKQEIKGKRYSEAIEIIKSKDGVQNATIDLSPFWVSHVPSNTGKVNIKIEVSENTLQ